MSSKIKQKYFGNLQLDNLSVASKEIPGKVEKTEQYGHQIKVKAQVWEDDGITIDIWDNKNKKSDKLGRLILDKDYVQPQGESVEAEIETGGLDF